MVHLPISRHALSVDNPRQTGQHEPVVQPIPLVLPICEGYVSYASSAKSARL